MQSMWWFLAAAGLGIAEVFTLDLTLLMLAGGAIALASLGAMVSPEPIKMSDGLARMVDSSTPLEAVAPGSPRRPTVLEFYRPACKYCNLAASSGLAEVEAQAEETDEPSVKKQKAYECPLNKREMSLNKRPKNATKKHVY